MAKVALPSTAETRAQILQLIALEKLANGKEYTIKSYLEYLVSLAAHGKFDEAGKLNIEIKLAPVDFRVDGPQLRAIMAKLPGLSMQKAQEGATRLRAITDDDERLFGQGAPKKDE